MSFAQLVSRLTPVVKQDLLTLFNNSISQLASGGSCQFYTLFDRLSEPVKDNLGNDMPEFTTLNKTSVMGE